MLELLRVLGANVGSAALKVLRVTDTTHTAINVGIAEAAVDDDGAAAIIILSFFSKFIL